MSDYDQFNDVKNRSLGIFGEDASGMEPTLTRHDSVNHTAEREGVMLEFYCQGCGRGTRILIEWPELVAMKYGHNPALIFGRHPGVVSRLMSWVYVPAEQSWRPDAKCRHCNFNFCIRLSPEEPERYLKVGRRSKFINPTGEQQISQLCSQAAQPAGGGFAVPPRRQV